VGSRWPTSFETREESIMKTEDLEIGQEYLESDRANWRQRTLHDYGMHRVRLVAIEERGGHYGKRATKVPMVLRLDPATGEVMEYGSGTPYEPMSTLPSRLKGKWSDVAAELERVGKTVSDWRFDAERRSGADRIAANNGAAELAAIGVKTIMRTARADMGGTPPGQESGSYASSVVELSADQADRLAMFLIALSDAVDVRVRPDGSGWDFRPVPGLGADDVVAAARPEGFTP
jgi:hypothetical protein